ncbi:hypothetical protein [Bradyrhizobium australiense]|uniref:hypothetical protein n=1 Tax=Bradyrhizobium australiense TaxID=2721161 RepID=UPI004064BF84
MNQSFALGPYLGRLRGKDAGHRARLACARALWSPPSVARHLPSRALSGNLREREESRSISSIGHRIKYLKVDADTITPKERPPASNVVDLMEAPRRSVGQEQASKPAKQPKRATSGQKEMLRPIAGKKQAKETAANKPSAKQRKSA